MVFPTGEDELNPLDAAEAAVDDAPPAAEVPCLPLSTGDPAGMGTLTGTTSLQTREPEKVFPAPISRRTPPWNVGYWAIGFAGGAIGTAVTTWLLAEALNILDVEEGTLLGRRGS